MKALRTEAAAVVMKQYTQDTHSSTKCTTNIESRSRSLANDKHIARIIMPRFKWSAHRAADDSLARSRRPNRPFPIECMQNRRIVCLLIAGIVGCVAVVHASIFTFSAAHFNIDFIFTSFLRPHMTQFPSDFHFISRGNPMEELEKSILRNVILRRRKCHYRNMCACIIIRR